MQTLLHYKTLQIDYAQNRQIAVNKCLENTYDAILMDIRMPVMNGIDATKEIKKHQPKASIVALIDYTDDLLNHNKS